MIIEEIERNKVGSKEPKGSEKMGQGSASVKRNMFGRRASDRFQLFRVLTLIGLALAISALLAAVAIFFSFEARLQLMEREVAPTFFRLSSNMQIQRDHLALINSRIDALEGATPGGVEKAGREGRVQLGEALMAVSSIAADPNLPEQLRESAASMEKQIKELLAEQNR